MKIKRNINIKILFLLKKQEEENKKINIKAKLEKKNFAKIKKKKTSIEIIKI